VITEANVDKAKDLISPGLEWCVRFGMPLRRSCAEAGALAEGLQGGHREVLGQVKLAADGLTMRNYVAGQPFPNLDPMDPQVANEDHVELRLQLLHHRRRRPAELRLRHRLDPKNGPMTIERHFALDHFRRLFWTGRLYVEPKPAMPNPNGLRRQEGCTRCSSRST
jgi:hypothetical protein